MLNQLSRILLALVTAFVFSGQMEAAAEHCARLAHEAGTAAEAAGEAPPCHETAAAVVETHHQAPHHAPADDATTPTQDHCQCVAALSGFTHIPVALASSRVAPYVWLSPEAERFASSRPDPDFRPPRA